MKLLKGNGKTVEIRDVGEPIYRMEAKGQNVLPMHGYKIVSDDEAREFISQNKHLSNNENLTK